MEWIATGVAIIAALVAGWQAWEARRARLDARSSASEAQQHEERAAAASERIATAIEERNALERAEREKYRDPWTIDASSGSSSRVYRFLLWGDEPVTDVRVVIDDQYTAREKFRTVKPDSEPMRPGETVTLTWFQHHGSASQITAELHWKRPNGDAHSRVVTLD